MRRALVGITTTLVAAGLLLLAPLPASADLIVDQWEVTDASGSLVVSPDGTRVYVAINELGSSLDRIDVFDSATGDVIATYSGPSWNTYAFGLALSADGTRLYASSEGTNQLFVFDTATGVVVDTVATGDSPFGIALGADGGVHVVMRDSHELQVFAGTPLAAVGSVPLPSGSAPLFVGLSPDGSTAYTSNSESGTVSVIDVPTLSLSATIPVGGSPRGLAVSPDGSQLAVATYTGNLLVEIDTATLATASIPVPSAYAPVYHPEFPRLYAARFSDLLVDILELPALTVLETVGPVSSGPRQIAVSPIGDRVYVSSQYGHITVIQVEAAPTITTAALPDGEVGVAYAAEITADSVPAATFAVSSGTLPPGLELDAATGAISGTPTESGEFPVEITATNEYGSDVVEYLIEVAASPVSTDPTDPTDPPEPTLPPTGSEPVPAAVGAVALLALGAVAVAAAALRRSRLS